MPARDLPPTPTERAKLIDALGVMDEVQPGLVAATRRDFGGRQNADFYRGCSAASTSPRTC